ncbi:MAG: DUF6064 family protein [Bacteroidota bacterium]|nr:DUF6064 family protein [Bacteroidota bacterium]MDP4275943.1 DUF6064 family protein [Bacteroidota bacterium]
MEIFWKTIAEYNSATWLYQILIVLTGIVLTIRLVKNPNRKIKIAMKSYMIFLNLWIAIVYYLIYCSERKYNIVLTLFWAIIAFIWVWDLIKGHTSFQRNYKYDIFAYILLAMPFLYPIFSLKRGLEFPAITSPVMPCSVAVFSIGLLLLFSEKVNMYIVLFLCHWSIIAISKTYFFDIPEDFLLASTSVPALYLFFKEYFANNLHKDMKSKAKYINLLLVIICIIIGVLLTATLFIGLKG